MQTFYDDIQFLGRTYFTTNPDQNISESVANTTPTVSNLDLLVFKNIGALSITNFLGGNNGQLLLVIGDGQTTVNNNANILTSTVANKLLGLHLYIFVLYKGIWYEK